MTESTEEMRELSRVPSDSAADKQERRREIVKLLCLGLLSFGVFSIFNAWPSMYTALFGISCIFIAARLLEWSSSKTERFPMKNRPVLITGCDTGFGHALALQLSQIGATVFAGCLNAESEGAEKLKAEKSERLHVLQMDVTKPDQLKKCFKYVQSKLTDNKLWAVVNNAGVNFIGAVETTSMHQYENIVNVNQLGMVRVTKEFLPLVRKSKGRIVNVSSVRGLVPEPFCAVYCMTKNAAEAFSDVLRIEMKPFGVSVSIVEPGDYGSATGCLNLGRIENDVTAMWSGMSDDLRSTYGKEFVDQHLVCAREAVSTSAQNIQPVIDAMINAVFALSPKARYVIHGGSGWFDHHVWRMRIRRHLPEFITDSMWMHDFRKWPTPTAVQNDPSLQHH